MTLFLCAQCPPLPSSGRVLARYERLFRDGMVVWEVHITSDEQSTGKACCKAKQDNYESEKSVQVFSFPSSYMGVFSIAILYLVVMARADERVFWL